MNGSEGLADVDAALKGRNSIAENLSAVSGRKKRLSCLKYDETSCRCSNGVGIAGNPHARTSGDLIGGPRGCCWHGDSDQGSSVDRPDEPRGDDEAVCEAIRKGCRCVSDLVDSGACGTPGPMSLDFPLSL